MTIGAPDFECVTCERWVDRRWWSARDGRRVIPPMCAYCEAGYAKGVGQPKFGSFMDRRNALRVAALSEALHGTASSIEWRTKYGRS